MPLDLEGKVCPRHSDLEAVARCFACFKPVCELCLVKSDGHDFCSEKCAESHAKTDASFQEFMEVERKQRRKRLIRRTLLFILFLGVGYMAIRFWISNPDTVSEWFSLIGETFGTLKETIKETMQGFM